MKIILDNIIFQLQVSGGISNYWFQLIKNLTSESNLEISFFGDKHSSHDLQTSSFVTSYSETWPGAIPHCAERLHEK